MATFPGMNPSFDIGAFPPDDQRVIRRFARHFYITRAADAVQIGNSRYRSFLMRPAEELSIILNVEREIPVLFSDYETFESRTLTAYDALFEQFDDARVDRSVRMLVSRDLKIEQQIRHYLAQDPEYPILIPFHYSHFAQTSDDFIFSAIRKNYLIRDLFGYQSPLRQEYFYFGRSHFVEGVIDIHRSGQNSGLFGLRKSGKTSTIFAIQRRAKTAGYRTLWINCEDPAIHARRFGSLLEYILSALRHELNLKRIDIDLGSNADTISDKFRVIMDRSLNEARTDILLIFDEIEKMSPKTAASEHWRNGEDALLFWQILRARFQSPTKYRVSFCFVGTNPQLFESPKIGTHDNPVYLFAPKTFIPMLTSTESQEMVKRLGYFMGLDFSDAVISHIHRRFGGHPFFIRQFCSEIHKRTPITRPREVSLTMCEDAERDGGADIRKYLRESLEALKELYPEEHEMLEYLAKGERATFHSIAAEAPEFVEHLIGYGIIVRRGDDYEFAFDAMSEAIEKRLLAPTAADIDERRIEIGRRRNKIEEEIRGALYRWARRLPKGEWERSLSLCIAEHRKSVIGDISIQKAFSKRGSPLYFMELLKLVQRAADELVIEGITASDVTAGMHLINKHRDVDAHASTLTDTEYEELSKAFVLLESVFLAPE